MREPPRELVHGVAGRKVGLADLARRVRLGGLGVLDFGGREGAASGDVGGAAAAASSSSSSSSSACALLCGLVFSTRDIEDVQLAVCGRLDGVLCGRVVRDMVPVQDVLLSVSILKVKRVWLHT